MPHCQICLTPVPDHAPNCPVATGEPVAGRTDLQWVQQMRPGGQFMSEPSWHLDRRHDPAAIELRIEWLEKEVHLLRARIAKLERAP